MNKIKAGLTVTALLLIGSISFFWQDIQEIRALQEYAGNFEPDVIDENFRTFHHKYPSTTIEREGPVYELPISLKEDALPETYQFGDQSLNLEEFLERSQTTGMAIMHGGRVIYENYRRGNTKTDRNMMASVSKSMASMLVGTAVDDGLIDVNDQVTKYAPVLKGSAYDGVTVKDALEMSSGVQWVEDTGDLNSELVRSLVAMLLGSLDEFTLTLERAHEPGTYHHYASMDTHVLGMVLRGATGMPYEEYFHEKLWSKLGAEADAEMIVDSTGQPLAYGGVNIRLRDMIRFGKLYLDEGRNHLGEQIVSSDWVKVSTKPDAPRLMPMVDNPNSSTGFGYKHQWWIPLEPDNGDYSAIGIYGQFVYINPKRDIVIAKTSAYVDYPVSGGMMNHETLNAFQSIAKHISPDTLAR